MNNAEEKPKLFCVYCHTNKINGKRYVGITSRRPDKRWGYGKAYKHNSHFTSAIQKYGWENFEHEVIASDLEEGYAKSFEKMLINLYRSTDRICGYNKSTGGESGSGVKFTAERRHKISKALTGIKRSEETKKKISEAVKKRPTEMQQRFAKSQIGHIPWNKGLCGTDNPNYGSKRTEEQRKHISESLKGKHKSPEHRAKISKPVRYIPTGIIYASITDASKKSGTPLTSISNHCKKKVRCQKWEFVEMTL